MRRITLWLTILLCLTAVNAQSLLDDEPDVDAYLERFSGGIVTDSMVADLKARATSAFDGGNCQSAIPLLEEWATQTNTLANLYRQTLRPFYRSTRSERDSYGFSFSSIEDLSDNEGISNSLIRDRNIAWVYLGECHVQTGDEVRALSYFSQALDRMSVFPDEVDMWNRAAAGIISIIDR